MIFMTLEVMDYAFYRENGAFLVATSGNGKYQIHQAEPIENRHIFYRTIDFRSEAEIIDRFEEFANFEGWRESNDTDWPFDFSRRELEEAIARFDGNY